MSGEALRREDAIRGRLRSFRDLVARSEATIAEALTVCARPYVAVSGGKDSLVTLALVRRQRPDVEVIWSDDELVEEATPGYVRALGGERLVIVQGFTDPQPDGAGGWLNGHAGWFHSWFWPPFFRAPEPDMLPIGQRVETWSRDAGYDLAFVGLRASERHYRRMHAARRGLLYQSGGQWRCQPLAWWTVDDVWAAIAAWGLPYNPAYDDKARVGVPRERQRVGPLPYEDGWVLRAVWPDLHRRLVARYGDHWGG